MSFDRLHYEFRLLGRKVVLLPMLVMGGLSLLALLFSYLKFIAPERFLLGGIEMILPLTVGMIIGNVVIEDPALELQLTMPCRYDRTAMQRLALIMSWTAGIAVLSSLIFSLFHLAYIPALLRAWSPFASSLLMQLVWLAPLVWCMGIGFCLTLLTRSWTGSAALLGSIWIVQIAFKNVIALTAWLRPVLLFPTTLFIYDFPDLSPANFTTYWLDTRLEVVATGVVLLLLGWFLLHKTERLLKGMNVA